MKKYLLTLIVLVCAVTGAWADSTVDIRTSGGTTTITITGDGNANVTFVEGCENLPGTAVNTVITGPLTQVVWTAISSNKEGWNTQAANGQIIDLRGVTGLTTSELLSVGMFNGVNGTNNTSYIILPKGSSVPTAAQTKNNTSPSFDNWDALQYFVIPQADGSCKVVLVDPINSINTEHLVLDNSTTVDVVGITDDDQDPPTEQNVKSVIAQLEAAGYKTPPVTVSGCTVSINIDNAGSKDLTTLLVEAKTAVVDGGQNGICTLTVTGTMSNLDLAALGDASMAGATRIDLSGATLASGATIENIRIPSTLTSLVLPKNMTVSEGLATKLAAYTKLMYAYSPSTGVVDANNHPVVADYVWVNQTGGLKAALKTEESLRTSKYIKVASDVELKTDDINFGNANVGAMDNLVYFDLRYANMSYEDAVAKDGGTNIGYVAPSSQGYRLILPDDWTAEQMTSFATGPINSQSWAMAALYSYSGSTLNIYALVDSKYMPTALTNSRIVYPGTTTISVVNNIGVTTENGTSKSNLLSALNAASSDVKTIKIAGSSYNSLEFTNPNITLLDVSGIDGSSVVLNVDGCTRLQTLNLAGSTLASVDASVAANSSITPAATGLTSVNLTGATINGITDFSNSPLTTLTTTSGTWLKGDLNLTNTALTTFAPLAKVGTNTDGTGNIYLNATTTLQSIDITSTDFQNSTSKIHIDKSSNEADVNTDALDALHRTVGNPATAVPTISVPNGFASSTRIHPYNEVKDNISEAAASGSTGGIDGCENSVCTITYDADTKTATVHAPHAGHFAALMATNYAKYPEGTTFKFDNETNINLDDLKALAGTIGENDYSWRSNYYYVDLFDLTATDDLCANTTGVIYQAIEWLRTNDRQFKGLILPKDHTLYGSGISLIQDGAGSTTNQATCSEFIAYYKTQEMVENTPTDLTKKILYTHVYNQRSSNGDALQASNDKLTELLTAHGLNGAGANAADLYSVSTNSVSILDNSALVGSKGYVETFNNEMVGTPTTANIYAYPKTAGEFTTFVNTSSISVTPTEVLKIDGTVSSTASDVAASINKFTNGPRVLDLSGIDPNDDTFLGSLLAALTNSNIEYIILPEGKSKSLVCGTTYSASMDNLKAVISSSDTELVAYVKQAGSLAEARYYATGGSKDENTQLITPSKTGLQSVTLAGNLNASDITANPTDHHVDASGHWTTGSANLTNVALNGEQGTITKIDLKDAVFGSMDGDERINQTDMNFSYAGLGSIHDITLPTDPTMTLIPAECFMGITSFDDLCIPYNYTKIDNKALYNTYMSHLTTTDANGALVDNGPLSYTFSKNLEEIGTKPGEADANGVYSLSETVFPQNRGVTDVYVLAHKVPKCYANAFPANMYYGWGGFKGGDFPYCREKYDNSSDGSLIFTVLHFPDEASYNEASDKESSYGQMKKYYTDVNKKYTKKEQTGAVDANGDPIAWPTFAELRRVYNQATDGITWYEWTTELDDNGEVQGGAQIPTAKNAITAGYGDYDYEFVDYEGWHQFVLSMATYVEPDKTVENEVIKNSYVQAGWYTLCIPYDLTEDQVKEMLGVPASVSGKVENYVGEKLIDADDERMPDLHTLKAVTRTPGTNGASNKVLLQFTQKLNNNYLIIDEADPSAKGLTSNGTNSDGKSIAIKGGYPYLVKPYLPADQAASIRNLGEYVMTHFGKQLTNDMSCITTDNCYQDLAPYSDNQKTGRFAKPFEGHKVQAYWDDTDDETPDYRTHADGTKYYYTFVGQFWDQPLPMYSFYMVEKAANTNAKWYRLVTEGKSYTWNKYRCVVMVTKVQEDAAPEGRSYLYETSGKFRDNSANHSNYPESTGLDAQGGYKFGGQLKIEFLDGRDDSDFTEADGAQAGSAKYIFCFDDIVQEFDENGNEVTAIDRIDGMEINSKLGDDKVYNMAGQYVGNSLNGLSRGLYIVNGKKVVVQ